MVPRLINVISVNSDDFLGRLAVSPIGADRFQGVCHPAWPGRAFGGQLAAQSVTAAAGTVAGMDPWSLHIYFHAPVRSNEPVEYQVERVKQGRTLASRRVLIEQDSSLRASATVLFGAPGEGPRHQFQQPDVSAPDTVAARERFIDTTILPLAADWEQLGYPQHALVDLRALPGDGESHDVWLRVLASLPDDPVTVAATFAYLSDICLGTTALEPHGGRSNSGDLQLGALELGLWFTAGARLDEWTLFSTYTGFAGGGHALAHGVFYNSDGEVAAAAIQNALMRWRPQ